VTARGTAAGSRRRLLLLSGVLMLLAIAAVAIAHFYWTDLRGGVARMRDAVAVAQVQQQRLLERLEAAQAALAERASGSPGTLGDPPAAAPPTVAPAAGAGLTAGADTRPPAVVPPAPSPRLTAPERARLAALIRGLEREAVRLRPGPGQGRGASAKALLRDQLRIAAAAAAAGDVALLDAALFAAQRLAATPQQPRDARAGALAARLRELRAGLRAPARAAPGAAAAGPVQPSAPRAAVPAR
jgi:hypothetical protein